MTPREILAAVGTVLIALAAGLWVIQGPLYRTYSAEECVAAYRQASTVGDTARVDLHPYASPAPDRAKHRCGEVRARLATSADILPR